MLHKTPDPQLKKPFSHKLLGLFSLFVAGWLATAGTVWAAASWQWLDETGRKVFSDTPPPPSIPTKNILKQPGAQRNALPQAEAPVPEATPKPAGTQAKTADPAEDKKKRDANKAEEAQRKADECNRRAEKLGVKARYEAKELKAA